MFSWVEHEKCFITSDPGFTISVILFFSLVFCYFVLIRFSFNILITYWWNLTILCIHIIMERFYVRIVMRLFLKNLQQVYGPWLTSEYGFTPYLENQKTKKKQNFVYTLSITRSILVLTIVIFRKFATRVMALDLHQNLFLHHTLRMNE